MTYKVVRLELPSEGAARVLATGLSLREALAEEIRVTRKDPLMLVGVQTSEGVPVSRRIHLVNP